MTPYSPQAALALARRARGQLLPRLAEAVSSSARCAAVLMIAVWENACGKLPSSRLREDRIPPQAGRDRCAAPAGARTARPRRHAARSGPGCWPARSCRREKRLRPAAARRSRAARIAADEAVLHQLALDRHDRAADPRVVRRQKAELRDQQQRGVEVARAVILDEGVALRVIGLVEDLRRDPCRAPVPSARAAPRARYCSTDLMPRSKATQP